MPIRKIQTEPQETVTVVKEPTKSLSDIVKPHLSVSQLKTYVGCSAKWYYRYIQGIKTPKSMSLHFGSCFDEAMNTNYTQKMATRKDLTAAEASDVFSTNWNGEIGNVALDKDDVPSEQYDTGIKCVREYMGTIAPSIQPRAVQKKVKVTIPNFDYDFVGFIDLIDQDDVIIDNKTAANSPPMDKATGLHRYSSHDDFLQMIAYATFGPVANEGIIPPHCRLDYTVKLKTPKVIQVKVMPTAQDKGFLMDLMGRVADGIKHEVFIPNRNNNLCSRKYCGYYDMCHAEFC